MSSKIAENNIQLEAVQQQLKNEESGIHKLKVSIKTQLKQDMERARASNESIAWELRRINTYLDLNQEVIHHIIEDQMLNQLMLEQDIVDRKQIGLFGAKKNSQILGTNQHAMTNNCKRSLSNSSIRNLDLPLQTSWDLRNKAQEYSQIVYQSPTRNSRGDRIRDEVLRDIPEAGAKSPLKGLDLETCSYVSPSKPLSIIDEKRGKASNFKANLESKISNTVQVDRNCVSCSGYASQILSQIKVACLSYVNSPVKFGQDHLLMTDLVQVKELLLKKCEIFSHNQRKVLTIRSNFGTIWSCPMSQVQESQVNITQPSSVRESPVTKRNSQIDLKESFDSKNPNIKIQEPGQMIKVNSAVVQDTDSQTQDLQENQQIKQVKIRQTVPVGDLDNIPGLEKSVKEQKDDLTDRVLDIFFRTPDQMPKFNIETLNKLIVKNKKIDYENMKKKEVEAALLKDKRKGFSFDEESLKQDIVEALDLNNTVKVFEKLQSDDFGYRPMDPQEQLEYRTASINIEQNIYGRLRSYLAETEPPQPPQAPTLVAPQVKKQESRAKSRDRMSLTTTSFRQSSTRTAMVAALKTSPNNFFTSKEGDFMILGDGQVPPRITNKPKSHSNFMNKRKSQQAAQAIVRQTENLNQRILDDHSKKLSIQVKFPRHKSNSGAWESSFEAVRNHAWGQQATTDKNTNRKFTLTKVEVPTPNDLETRSLV